MVNVAFFPLRFLLATFVRHANRHQRDVIEYLLAENRVLREQLRGRKLRFSDDQRRRLGRTGSRTRA